MLGFALLFCVAGLMASLVHQDKVQYDLEKAEELFEEYIWQHDREYAHEIEKQARFEIFKQNLQIINEKNLRSENMVHGITRFSDMTHEEFLSTLNLMYSPGLQSHCYEVALNTSKTMYSAPDSFDWRDKNAVTRVKNQGHCGSCWAFSTTGTVEGNYAIKHGELIEISEQQLLDCDEQSRGCIGGSMDWALMALIKEGGALGEEDYPYEAQKSTCRLDKSKIKVQVTGCNHLIASSEDELTGALPQFGPLSIIVDASGLDTYVGGILEDCPGNHMNHAVLLVGYGTENGVPFWIIKNSWAETWGESGYMRIKRGINACGILNAESVAAIVA